MAEKKELHTEIREKLNGFLKNNNVPHLLFYGPHGSGKKRSLMIMLTLYFPRVKKSDRMS